LCKPWIQKQEKALIIGCNAGRSSFELAKYFERVTGIDFTARLIKVAEKMKSGNKIRYQVPIEGELMALREVTLDELNLSGSPEKVEFWQADASNLAAKFKDYDFVLSQNVLEYIYDPDNFLKIIQRRINTGGILVIASSYDWDNEIIKKGKQLGGYRRDGEPYFSINALHNILDENFTEIKSPADLPFIIRQNARNFLYKIAQISFWQKKSTTLKITG
jgi:putative 4-mercaptohistidine N1-methyltranferase